MKISYNWLKEFVDINISPEKLAEVLTMRSFEVEEIIYQGEGLDNVVVGEVLEVTKHPDADRLSLVKVNVGKELSLRESDSDRSNPVTTTQRTKSRDCFSRTSFAMTDNSDINWLKNKNYQEVSKLRELSPTNFSEFGLKENKGIYGLVNDLEKLDFLVKPEEDAILWERALE